MNAVFKMKDESEESIRKVTDFAAKHSIVAIDDPRYVVPFFLANMYI